MDVIGIAGVKGAGKSTLSAEIAAAAAPQLVSQIEFNEGVIAAANNWRERFPEPDHPIAMANRWVDHIPRTVRKIAGIAIDHSPRELYIDPSSLDSQDYHRPLTRYLEATIVNPDLLTQPIDSRNKGEHTDVLEWLGARLAQHVSQDIWSDVVLGKLDELRAAGVDIATVAGVRFERDVEQLRNYGALIVKLVGRAAYESLQPAEVELSRIKPDVIVNNSGPIEKIGEFAIRIVNNVRNWQGRPDDPIYLAPWSTPNFMKV